MDLVFGALEDAELYLYFDNLYFEKDQATSCKISVSGLLDEKKVGKITGNFSLYTEWSHLYGGKHDWLLNLGVIPKKVTGLRVKFETAGTYTMDGIYVYARDRSDILRNIRELNHQVSGVSFSKNEMRVSLENTEEEYLFAAVPYSEGWQAYDQGNPLEILKADVGFMALRLDPGKHEIQFVYKTPGFVPGALISIGSVVCFIAIILLRKKRTVKNRLRRDLCFFR